MEKASIFLLFLNPGFSPGDYYAAQHVPGYAAAIERNLTQQNGADPHPFFFLNPQFAWTAGGTWWQKKLRSIAEKLVAVAGRKEFRLQEAFQLISQHLACVEMYPYHSQSFRQSKDLKSKELACEYVKEVLVPKAEKGEALIVATRQAKAWPLPPPSKSNNIVAFSGAQARGAHLTVDAENKGGGAAIFERLKPLLARYQK